MLILAVGFASLAVAVASPAPTPAAASPSPAAAGRPLAAPARPTPSPTPLPVLEGAVRGPDGKPLAEARVLTWIEQMDVPHSPAATSTDAAGHFRVALRSRSPVTVRVEARGLAARIVRHVRVGAPLSITLAPGVTMQGVVRDGASGSPVAGATVEAREEMRAAASTSDADTGVARTTTGAKGDYRLEGLAPGLYTLSAFAGGLGRADRRSAPTGRPADLNLMPGGSVVGAITDAAGKPVDGAAVRLMASVPFAQNPNLQATADAHGAFAVHGVAPSEYRVMARHADLAPALSAPVSVDRDGEARVDLVMASPAEIRGRLVIAAEKPVPGVVLVREIAGAVVPASLQADLVAEAGADGVFRLPTAPGAQVLEVRAPGYAPRRLDADASSMGAATDLGDITLEAGIAIHGHVRDGAGRPVENALVSTSSDETYASYTARTDAAGAFVVAGLPAPGLYLLAAAAPGLGRAERKAEAGARGVDLVLQGAGTITGAVVDDAGRPIQAFRVAARMVAGGSYRGMRGETFGADDGRFSLDDVAQGEYVVDVSAPDRTSTTVSGIKVASGGGTDMGTVRLASGGIVRGLVADAAGAPVSGATVSVTGPGRDFSRIPPQAVTDGVGAFEVAGVSPGTVQVSAAHPSFAISAALTTEVDLARGPTDVKIVLSEGGRIEGRVRTRDGLIPAGAVVAARSAARGIAAPTSGPAYQPLAADGSFTIEHAPVGRVVVTLMAGQGEQFHGLAQADAEVREGETTPVDIVLRTIAITGKLTRSGAPLAGARVEFETAHGGMMYMSVGSGGSAAGPPYVGISREDGTYQLTVSEPGEVWVQITSADRKTTFPVPPVQVPDTDAYVADFTFSGSFVDGVIVDRETERPIPGGTVWAQPVKPSDTAPSGGFAEADVEGRFHLEVDPGDYRLVAHVEGYGGDPLPVTVGENGATGVRLALVQGLVITGRVVDVSGRGVVGVRLLASTGQGADRSVAASMSRGDGSFQLSGLRESRYMVAAIGGDGTFAMASVSPSLTPLTLTLRPGVPTRVKVLGPTGAPVSGAYASVVRYQGVSVNLGGGTTDAAGMADLVAPAGSIQILASSGATSALALTGSTTLTVAVGTPATAVVTLKMPEKSGP
jgi:large repetitive protein